MGKSLAEMTLTELWQLFPIEIKPYSAVYPAQYERESSRILSLIGDFTVRLSHIGSTAVAGLYSKPIVDILAEIRPDARPDTVKKMLEREWVCMNLQMTPLRMSFNKGYTERGYDKEVFHLHVVNYGSCDELYFRDYLIDNPDVAAQYAALKKSLLRFRFDRDGYTRAKTDFVLDCVKKAKRDYGDRYKPL